MELKSFSEDITTNGQPPTRTKNEIRPFSEGIGIGFDVFQVGRKRPKEEVPLKDFENATREEVLKMNFVLATDSDHYYGQKALRALPGTNPSNIRGAFYRAEKGEKLTSDDKKILQAGWPHIHGARRTPFIDIRVTPTTRARGLKPSTPR